MQNQLSNSKKVAIIILNYNSYSETINLIDSINKKEKNKCYDIIVIDNASNENERNKIKSISDCILFYLSENEGYAKGNNYGVEYAYKQNYRYILIANSDTEIIQENTIEKLICAMEANSASIIGPCVCDKIGNSTAGAGNINRFGKVKEKRCYSPVFCQSIIGAFFIMKTDVISKVGLMKEYYFLYLEETDFFYNAFKKGLKILYYPKVSIIHYGGTTTSRIYDYYISRNRFILVRDNFKTNYLVLIIYLAIEFFITDLKQFIACKMGLRDYDYLYKHKMRWMGFKDGLKGVKGKREFKF